MNFEEVKRVFHTEFRDLAEKFQIHYIRLTEAADDKTPGAASPWVYVFLTGDKVIKVGRHLQNSRKRALEHIVADTAGKMASLRNDKSAHIALFNIQDVKNLHWVCALEVYFEQNLQSEVRSARLG